MFSKKCDFLDNSALIAVKMLIIKRKKEAELEKPGLDLSFICRLSRFFL